MAYGRDPPLLHHLDEIGVSLHAQVRVVTVSPKNGGGGAVPQHGKEGVGGWVGDMAGVPPGEDLADSPEVSIERVLGDLGAAGAGPHTHGPLGAVGGAPRALEGAAEVGASAGEARLEVLDVPGLLGLLYGTGFFVVTAS